jgi:type I restriction enzyme S subunit
MCNNVPKLRFPEFSSDWKVEKISNVIMDYRLGGNYQNILVVNPHPLIKMGNISRSFFNTKKVEYISNFEVLNDEDKINYGDLFFNTRNTLELVGKVAVWRNELDIAYYNSNLLRLKFANNFFFNYLFNSFNGIKSLRRIASGTTSVAAIYTKDLLNLKVSFPSDDEEQQKIADFLSSVDKKIGLLKEKHVLLDQYKKGVMQKLFSQEIRFKDENGNDFSDWLIEPIGKFLKEYKERVPVGTDIPVLTSSRTGLYLQARKVINEGELGVVPKGYFTYRHMSDDLVFKFNLNRVWDKGAVSKEYPVFKAVGMNSYFLELSLNEGNDFKRFAIQQKVGGTRTRLYYKNLVKLKLNTPSLAEQNKIAGFLQTLDKKIKLVAEQLEQNQAFKKGLLQQLFV